MSQLLQLGRIWRIHEVVSGVLEENMELVVYFAHYMTSKFAVNDGPRDAYTNFVSIANDIPTKLVYTTKCNDIQPHYLCDVVNEKHRFPLPIYFCKTSTNL